MSQSVLRLGGVVVLGLAAFFWTAESSQGAGHGGGGFHGGGFHAGGFGGFHAGGYHGGWGGYRGSYHGGWGGYRGWHGDSGGYRRGLYGRDWYGWGYSPWVYGSWDYPLYDYGNYPSGDYTDYSYEPGYDTGEPGSTLDVLLYPSGSASTYGTYAAAPAADDTAQVTVRVPADAQVWFQNQPTTERGAVRRYQSPQLVPGREYEYGIRAQWREGGRVVSQTRHVDVQAGAHITVDFTTPTADQHQASAGAGTSGS